PTFLLSSLSLFLSSCIPLVFLLLLLPPRSTLFPYTTLFRSVGSVAHEACAAVELDERDVQRRLESFRRRKERRERDDLADAGKRDRKSTRLNSSHQIISYAVFCLKKKKNKRHTLDTIHKNQQ